ncbi:hypothetical protein [Streptomyces spiralis]|uniref:hypothetical protein n=1 Tax=Streptomyces spiralis TaxID=66376 RepID=UPI0036C52252
MNSLLSRTAISTAIGACLLFTGAAAASADTVTHLVSAGGTAPACIGRAASDLGGFVYVGNHCGKTMRVKVIIDFGPDSSCWTLAPEQVRRHNYYGSYGKTITC